MWKMWAIMAWTDTPSKKLYQLEINVKKDRSSKMMVHFSSRPRKRKRNWEKPPRGGKRKSLGVARWSLILFALPGKKNVLRHSISIELNHQLESFWLGFCRELNDAKRVMFKPGFHMSEKSQTIGVLPFADHPRFCLDIGCSPKVCPRFSRDAMFVWDRGTGAQQFRRLVMSEIHRWRTTSSPCKLEFSFVWNDCRPSQKSGTRRENNH